MIFARLPGEFPAGHPTAGCIASNHNCVYSFRTIRAYSLGVLIGRFLR